MTYPRNTDTTRTGNSGRKEDVFVDPVKQGLPKIFLYSDDEPQLWSPKAGSKPTAPSSPYIPRLVPNTCGFCEIHCSL